MKISSLQLKSICRHLTDSNSETLANLMNELFPIYGITTKERAAGFISQAAHESSDFETKSENLNYSAEGLKSTFLYYAKHPELAEKHGRTISHPANDQIISNTVYADKNRDEKHQLGNIFPTDGYDFRGGGFIQMTGRNMFTKYARYKGIDVKEISNIVRTDNRWALDSALWIFSIEKKLLDDADRKDVNKMSTIINGGNNGIDERRRYYNLASKILIA